MDDEVKVRIVKNVTDAVVGVGVGQIISGIVSNNVEPDKQIQRACVFAAKHVIIFMASEKTKKYTDEKIDNATIWWKENVVNGQRSTEEGPTNKEEEPEPGSGGGP